MFFFLNFALTFLILFPFFYVLLQRRVWFVHVKKLKWLWGSLIAHNAGVFYSVKREGKPHKNGTFVYVSNHTSYLDVVLSYVIIRGYFHTMGKAELRKIPLFGLFFKEMNIPVDRGSVRDSHKAFVRAGQDIEKGISIYIFPEGTIPPHSPRLGRFKSGPFRLAIEKQVPVVPITWVNNWKLLPDGKNSLRSPGGPGIARAIIHEPIPTAGMTEADVEALSMRVREVIECALKQYCPEYADHAMQADGV
jgi:1-acyl-sn-glycerol-3-phosphate acyltransferase